MSYQVISRKWRPGVFDDVVGQEHVVRTLTNAVDAGKVGHAYIFSGPRGVGKTTVARILAKCLNCEKGPTGSPCNECSICKSITRGSSVDTLEIDGASNNSVENVRELCESVRYAPTEGRSKVYIIDEVHMLSTPAFNALLKTLEEPPPNVIFIFATTEPQKIPATIHSRCQRFDFRRIPVETIHKRLRSIGDSEKITIDDEALYMLIREAEGSLRDAQSLLEQVMAFSDGDKITSKDVMDAIGLMDRSLVFELMEAVIDCNGPIILGVVEKAYNFGYDLKRIVLELLEQVRDITVIKTFESSKGGINGASLALPEAELERLKGFAEKVETPRLQMFFDLFSRGYDDVVRSSTPRFSVEMMLMGAVSLDELKSLGDIVSGLKGMKVGGEGGRSAQPRAPIAQRSAPSVSRAPSASTVVSKVEEPAIKAVVKEDRSPTIASSEASTETKAAEVKAASHSDKELTLDGFLDYVKSRKRLIYQSLATSSLDMKDDRLVISAALAKQAVLKEIKSDTAGLLKEYFKRNLDVEITLRDDVEAGELTSGEPAEGALDKDKAVKAGGRGRDPVVEDAMKTLGGKFIEERRRDDV